MLIFLAGHADAAAKGDQRVAIVQRVFHLRPARAIVQRLDAFLLVAIEDFIAGLPGNSELLAQIRHRLALDQARHKP